MTTQIYPCPHCQQKCVRVRERKAKTAGGVHYFVGCGSCNSEGPRSLSSKEDAITKWNTRATTPESSAAQGAMGDEVARPDLIEKLTYHTHECDDLTLDEALDFLAQGWKKVHGRTERQMVFQIVRLLASQPSDATAQPSHIPAHAKKIGTDTYGWQGSGASNESMQELMENVAAHPSVDDLPYDEKGDVLRFSRFVPKPSVDISSEQILEIAGDFICDAAGKSNVLFFARRLLANTAQGKTEHIGYSSELSIRNFDKGLSDELSVYRHTQSIDDLALPIFRAVDKSAQPMIATQEMKRAGLAARKNSIYHDEYEEMAAVWAAMQLAAKKG